MRAPGRVQQSSNPMVDVLAKTSPKGKHSSSGMTGERKLESKFQETFRCLLSMNLLTVEEIVVSLGASDSCVSRCQGVPTAKLQSACLDVGARDCWRCFSYCHLSRFPHKSSASLTADGGVLHEAVQDKGALCPVSLPRFLTRLSRIRIRKAAFSVIALSLF